MINKQLINPSSIVVVGGSNDFTKPGGKVIQNLLEISFKGPLYIVNPKGIVIEGVQTFTSVQELPQVDLAIIAIPAKLCPEAIDILTREKGTRAFIVFSAGFSEESKQGAEWEHQMVESVNKAGGCLIGPNCIGVLNSNYSGVFTLPIPKLHPQGCDFITGSGATAVYIIEVGVTNGLIFSQVFSVGNSAQLGVEDILEYLDESFEPETSSKVKLLYIENIKKPQKLLKHAQSLISKGCRIAAIKAGSSEAGSRAASSHTGALATSDVAVNALFEKAGIIRCYSRDELVTIASIFMYPPIKGKNIAIITHAGGPAVMLTDALSNGGLKVPPIKGEKADALLEKLSKGSSVANPIDFLATGTAEQLGEIIDACENDFERIDAMCVIFGSPGLKPVNDAYDMLDAMMKTCKKPIFPILPSIINAKDEIAWFIARGWINFPDEVAFGQALAKVYHSPIQTTNNEVEFKLDKKSIRRVIEQSVDGYLEPEKVQQLLDAAGIKRAKEAVVTSVDQACKQAESIGFPVVMKVVGPVHKSDVGGVKLNVKNNKEVEQEFLQMMKIPETNAVLIQPMLKGAELFAGAKYESPFGHMVVCGLGGIFIEVLKDIKVQLAPINMVMAENMIRELKSYKIFEGIRGQEPINQKLFAEAIVRLSLLCTEAPEIVELDLNPLLGNADSVIAVDARIRIGKNN